MSLPRLTAEEKILLHLAEWLSALEDYERPPEVTQRGIADATGIRRGYVAIVVGRMADKGIVEVSLARVRGKARSHKTYLLTPDGLAAATRLRRVLDAHTVSIDGVEVTFGEAVRRGLSPVQVVSLAEAAAEGQRERPTADGVREASGRERAVGYVGEDAIEGMASGIPVPGTSAGLGRLGDVAEVNAADGGPEGGDDVPGWDRVGASGGAVLDRPSDPASDRRPTGRSAGPGAFRGSPGDGDPAVGAGSAPAPALPVATVPSIGPWRVAFLATGAAGVSLLILALTLTGDRPSMALTYVSGLILMASALGLSWRAALPRAPPLIALLVIVHLSLAMRGAVAPDVLAIALVSGSLLTLFCLSPSRPLRAWYMAVAGAMLILHGVAIAVSGPSAGGHPEAWIALGTVAILMGGGGWGISPSALRGLCTGMGLFALVLVPLYGVDRLRDPWWVAILGAVAGGGVLLLRLGASGRPLRRILATAVLVAVGAAMLVLGATLLRFGLHAPALVEGVIAAVIIRRGLATARLRRATDVVAATYLGVLPALVLGYGIQQVLVGP